MPDAIPEPERRPVPEGVASAEPDWGLRYATDEGGAVPSGLADGDGPAVPEPAFDRYAIPEPEEIVPTYVRNETPWEGISGEPANPDLAPLVEGPAGAGDEPEFTRLVRARQRSRDTVAWMTTAALIITAAWFLPLLLIPASPLGRVGSFVALSVGGLAATVILLQTWRWAHRAA